jgi:hypothetical protein
LCGVAALASNETAHSRLNSLFSLRFHSAYPVILSKNLLGVLIELSASLKHRRLAESLPKPKQFRCCTSNSFFHRVDAIFHRLVAFIKAHFEAFWGHKMVDPSQIRLIEQLEM